MFSDATHAITARYHRRMALTACPECKAEMSTTAPACPKCGYRKPMSPGTSIAIKVIVAVALFVAIWFGGKWVIDNAFKNNW